MKKSEYNPQQLTFDFDNLQYDGVENPEESSQKPKNLYHVFPSQDSGSPLLEKIAKSRKAILSEAIEPRCLTPLVHSA